MGKGDKKSRRGKIILGTFGVRRPRKKTSGSSVSPSAAVAAEKPVERKKTAEPAIEKPAVAPAEVKEKKETKESKEIKETKETRAARVPRESKKAVADKKVAKPAKPVKDATPGPAGAETAPGEKKSGKAAKTAE